MKEIIFATGNKGKLAQINFIVEHFNFPVKIVAIRERYYDYVPYDEVGVNVAEVSVNGAVSVSDLIGAPVIVEDTDFVVDALGGAPGLEAGEFLKSFGRSEILKRMKNVNDRKATINSAVAYATPEGERKLFVNSVEGFISNDERFGEFPIWIAPNKNNESGGGYNSIFVPYGQDKTLAEINPVDSIELSYRDKNFISVIKYILNSCDK